MRRRRSRTRPARGDGSARTAARSRSSPRPPRHGMGSSSRPFAVPRLQKLARSRCLGEDRGTVGAALSRDRTPLIGRGPELGAIDAALDSVRRDRAGVCLALAGGLGLGKSRLLRELAARAEDRGDLVLGGQGSEWETGIPYGVTAEALED